VCRSHGIKRWPFRKLKSISRSINTEGAKTETKRPYTVGSKTVFLRDEELEVFKMTMGKSGQELKPVGDRHNSQHSGSKDTYRTYLTCLIFPVRTRCQNSSPLF